MSGYLFPIQRQGTTTPHEQVMAELLPSARRSILIVDPAPPADVLESLTAFTDHTITVRILTRPGNSLDAGRQSGNLLNTELYEKLTRAGTDLRVKRSLTSRIYIVDDTCLVISGLSDDELAYGVLLVPSDSQHIIEHWESVFRDSQRMTPRRFRQSQTRFLEQIKNGGIGSDRLVNLINHRGAFIDIHVNLFRNFRQMTLHPFRQFNVESAQDHKFSWKRIPATLYRLFHREISRIHSLKSRSYILDTPAGPFLPNTFRHRWEGEFAVRAAAFHRAIEEHIESHYSDLRGNAQETLRSMMIKTYRDVSGRTRLLPIVTEKDFIAYGDSIHESQFPTKDALKSSCAAWFVRFGLHPDSLEDIRLINVLTQLTLQTELL